MFKDDELIRLESIQEKLNTLNKIIDRHDGIVKALSDFEGQPAILMLLVAISEQFAKLKTSNSEILDNFDSEDIKGNELPRCKQRSIITFIYKSNFN